MNINTNLFLWILFTLQNFQKNLVIIYFWVCPIYGWAFLSMGFRNIYFLCLRESPIKSFGINLIKNRLILPNYEHKKQKNCYENKSFDIKYQIFILIIFFSKSIVSGIYSISSCKYEFDEQLSNYFYQIRSPRWIGREYEWLLWYILAFFL